MKQIIFAILMRCERVHKTMFPISSVRKMKTGVLLTL